MQHEELVLDRASLGAVANAQVALAIVGEARHDKNRGACVRGSAGELRELYVIADRDRDLAKLRIEDLELLPGLNVPMLTLEACHVELVLVLRVPCRREEVGAIEDALGARLQAHRHRARHDVDLVLLGEAGQQFAHGLRAIRHASHLLCDRAVRVTQRDELNREVLGEDEQATAVVRRRHHQPANLVFEVLKGVERPNEVLERRDANSIDQGTGEEVRRMAETKRRVVFRAAASPASGFTVEKPGRAPPSTFHPRRARLERRGGPGALPPQGSHHSQLSESLRNAARNYR